MCVAAAIAGAAVVSGGVGIYEGNKAAGAQQNAANQAQQTQQQQFQQTQQNLAPFRQAGVGATNQLGGLYGLPGYNKVNPQAAIANLPGYQFQLNQGVQALDRSAAAKGLLNSGAQGKALQQYGQGLAGNYFGQYAGGLENLAGMGQNASVATGKFGQQTADNISQDQLYSGQAQAQGDINTSNAINSGLNQGIGLYGQYQGQQRADQQQQFMNNLLTKLTSGQYQQPGLPGAQSYGAPHPIAVTPQ